MNFPVSSEVLVGLSHADDAGVIRIDSQTALVQTTDFLTPVVDDPYLFGQIAAANALSDIYAMGATPLSALNILCFPEDALDMEGLRQIIQGGADKVAEAGASVLGGHSVNDRELKFGLAVTGIIHPQKVKINRNLKPGDRLLLTKPIGVGILTTALKNEQLGEGDIRSAIDSMLLLNNLPGSLMDTYQVSACTDVTGFGLIGHLWEMANGLDLSVRLHIEQIPFFKEALPFAKNSLQIPGGTLANHQFFSPHIDMSGLDAWYMNLLFDPQTSGGLLISIPDANGDEFVNELKGYPFAVYDIGRVLKGENKIFIE